MTDDTKPGGKPDLKVVPDAKAPAKKKGKPAASKTKAKAKAEEKPVTDAEVDQAAASFGHNSINATTRRKLRQYVARIETLNAEKQEKIDDIKEVYGEVKSVGFDQAALRAVIRERAKDAKKRDDQISMFDLYWGACGT